MIATDVVIGKGVGAALEGLKEIPQIAKLLTKLEDLKSLSKVKIAETFSDEAASLARKRLIVGLVGIGANTPLPASFLKDFAVIAGNKLKNGGMKFADFAKQMIEEFGDIVNPYVEKLAREQIIKLGLTDKIDEVGSKLKIRYFPTTT